MKVIIRTIYDSSIPVDILKVENTILYYKMNLTDKKYQTINGSDIKYIQVTENKSF